jgi:hypothetical protein
VTQPERGFRHGLNPAGREFQNFQSRFRGHGFQWAGEAHLGKVLTGQSGGEVRSLLTEAGSRFHELVQDFAVRVRICDVGQALAEDNHIRKRTGHGQAVVMDLVGQRNSKRLLPSCGQAQHFGLRIATYDQVVNAGMMLQSTFHHRDAFRTFARSGE